MSDAKVSPCTHTHTQLPGHIPETGVHDDQVRGRFLRQVQHHRFHVRAVATGDKVESNKVNVGLELPHLCVTGAIVQLNFDPSFYQCVIHEGHLSLEAKV